MVDAWRMMPGGSFTIDGSSRMGAGRTSVFAKPVTWLMETLRSECRRSAIKSPEPTNCVRVPLVPVLANFWPLVGVT